MSTDNPLSYLDQDFADEFAHVVNMIVISRAMFHVFGAPDLADWMLSPEEEAHFVEVRSALESAITDLQADVPGAALRVGATRKHLEEFFPIIYQRFDTLIEHPEFSGATLDSLRQALAAQPQRPGSAWFAFHRFPHLQQGAP